jgi:Flp pilus assembly protein CpaB
MAARRSTQLVIIGASVFIIGAGLVFMGLHSDKKAKAPQTAAATTPAPGAGQIVVQGTTTQAHAPVVVPKGLSAVAVKLDHIAGIAGYAKQGDHVNLYATVRGGAAQGGLTPPFVKLVVQNVLVLDVTGIAADGSGDPTYLLALSPSQAEQAIFFARFESLWATLAPAASAPASTAGTDYTNDLAKR